MTFHRVSDFKETNGQYYFKNCAKVRELTKKPWCLRFLAVPRHIDRGVSKKRLPKL